MNIGKDLGKTEEYKSTWNGEEFSFTAKQHALTPRVLQQFREMEASPIQMANSLASILDGWTIDLDGEDFPPTAENLERVPIEFLIHIIEILGEKWNGKKQTPRQSQNTSEASAT